LTFQTEALLSLSGLARPAPPLQAFRYRCTFALSISAMQRTGLHASLGIHASPAKRMQLDEQRKLERLAKRGLNPGPGSYDVKRTDNPTRTELAGSSAFKSKSVRSGVAAASASVDPGNYNPFELSSMVAQSSKSFNKQAAVGVSGFGGKAKRDGVRDFSPTRTGTDIPGPGAYDAKLPESPESKDSAFTSQSKRGAYVAKQTTPGAGEYTPHGAQEKVAGGDSMFKSTEQRFKKSMELEYAAHVGPGSYDAAHGTVERKAAQESRQHSTAFASQEPRDTRIV
jgi:hypothetical protein